MTYSNGNGHSEEAEVGTSYEHVDDRTYAVKEGDELYLIDSQDVQDAVSDEEEDNGDNRN